MSKSSGSFLSEVIGALLATVAIASWDVSTVAITIYGISELG